MRARRAPGPQSEAIRGASRPFAQHRTLCTRTVGATVRPRFSRTAHYTAPSMHLGCGLRTLSIDCRAVTSAAESGDLRPTRRRVAPRERVYEHRQYKEPQCRRGTCYGRRLYKNRITDRPTDVRNRITRRSCTPASARYTCPKQPAAADAPDRSTPCRAPRRAPRRHRRLRRSPHSRAPTSSSRARGTRPVGCGST